MIISSHLFCISVYQRLLAVPIFEFLTEFRFQGTVSLFHAVNGYDLFNGLPGRRKLKKLALVARRA